MVDSGTLVPMLTPTMDSTDVDEETLGRFTEYLVDSGVDGLVPVGSLGEFANLARNQRQQVIRTTVKHAGGVPVVAGCGGTSVKEVREYVVDAADAGADAVLVVTPYYYQTAQRALERFFTTIADESPLPVFVYNIPQLTGVSLEPMTIANLADHRSIIGLKESSGDFTYFLDVLETVPSTFTVFQGIPMHLLSSLEHGADGVVAGPANVFPAAVLEAYDAYRRGDRDLARRHLTEVIHPVLRTIRSMPPVSAFKYLSANAGRDLGGPISPIPDVTDQQRELLDSCYRDIVQTGLVPAVQ